MRLSELTTKFWMKIDPHYQQRRCSPMTLDFEDIRFMRIFAGVPWRGSVKQQWGNRKSGFSGFRTLRLQYLRKWGQHYYILLFSPLSPFHWPQKHDLEWLFYVQFSIFTITNCISPIYRRTLYRIFFLYDVTSREVRKRTLKTAIRRILRIRERIANLSWKSSGRYIVGTLTNKANVIVFSIT